MTYCEITAQTVITVPNHRNLTAAWKLYGRDPLTALLVASFHCKASLTDAQLKRLPARLKRRLTVGSPAGNAFERFLATGEHETQMTDAHGTMLFPPSPDLTH